MYSSIMLGTAGRVTCPLTTDRRCNRRAAASRTRSGLAAREYGSVATWQIYYPPRLGLPLERGQAVFALSPLNLLVTEQPQRLAQQQPCLVRFNDAIDVTALGGGPRRCQVEVVPLDEVGP